MKRRPGLRELSDDHHVALVLARRCKRAARAGAADAELALCELRAALASELEPHFRIEELHLLPALEAIGAAGLAERIGEDHAALRALASANAEPVPAALEAFGRRLEAHVRFEERDVFEPTQDRLPEASLRAIEDAWRAHRRAGPEATGRRPPSGRSSAGGA